MEHLKHVYYCFLPLFFLCVFCRCFLPLVSGTCFLRRISGSCFCNYVYSMFFLCVFCAYFRRLFFLYLFFLYGCFFCYLVFRELVFSVLIFSVRACFFCMLVFCRCFLHLKKNKNTKKSSVDILHTTFMPMPKNFYTLLESTVINYQNPKSKFANSFFASL